MEDIKGQAEWLSTIKISHLNNRALTIASKLARGIRKANGNIVKLQDKSIAMNLAEEVASIDDPELHTLFRDFLEQALSNNTTSSDDIEEVNNKPTGLYRGVKIE